MEAIILKDFGGVENLEPAEVAVPTPGPGEILVGVRAISINPVDIKTRNGKAMASLLGKEKPMILGWDIAGEVLQSAIPKFRTGDRVFGMVNFPGIGRAYAARVAAPASQLALMPDTISFPEAAAATLAALTAWQALTTHATIKRGDRVLIHAGSGGVGHFAIQMARHLGAYVLTTTSAQNGDFVLGIGANEFIDYRRVPFEEAAGEIDFVLDTLGDDYIDRSLKTMKKGGTLISLPSGKNDSVSAKAGAVGMNGSSMMVKSSGTDMERIAELLSTGAIKSHIADTFLLKEMQKAHLQIETKRTRGKVVVLID